MVLPHDIETMGDHLRVRRFEWSKMSLSLCSGNQPRFHRYGYANWNLDRELMYRVLAGQ